MAETLGLLLADEIYICKVCDSLDLFVDFFLILLAGKICLKLEGMVEVVFDNSLAAVGYDKDVLDSRRNGLFYKILDSRLIDYVEHLLRDCLGRGENSCAETCRRDNGLFDFHFKPNLSLLFYKQLCRIKQQIGYNIITDIARKSKQNRCSALSHFRRHTAQSFSGNIRTPLRRFR